MKIINMGDYQMDDQDRLLRELFAHAPLADNGFSNTVVRRIRRRELLQRWLVPVALLIGAAVSAAPVLQLLSGFLQQVQLLLQAVPGSSGALVSNGLGSATVVMAMVLISALAVAVRLLEE